MTSVTFSNKSSAVYSDLFKYTDDDLMVYKLDQGLPNLSREILETTQQNYGDGTGTACSVLFNVIKAGLLRMCYLKIAATTSGAGTTVLGVDAALNCISYIQLMNNNKELETLYPQQIRAWINSLSAADQYKMNAACVRDISGAIAASTSVKFLVPLPFSFSEHISKNLDTNFVDTLSINCVMNANTSAMERAFTANSAKLSVVAEYLILDVDSYSKLRELQYRAGTPTTFLWKSSEKESNTTLATTTTINLTTKRPVKKTLIRQIKANTAGGGMNYVFPLSRFSSAANQCISNVQIKGNGKVLYEFNPFDYQVMQAYSFGLPSTYAAFEIATMVDGNICIDWELLKDKLPSECWIGGVSFKQLANPQIVLTVVSLAGGDASVNGTLARISNNDAGTAAAYIECVHVYSQLVQVEPNSGRMSVSSAM